jgi:hypothetical protein
MKIMTDAIKKWMGVVLMVAAPLIVAFMCWQAFDKISISDEAHRLNTILQWTIILIVFIPVNCGLVIFGYYAWKGYFCDRS